MYHPHVGHRPTCLAPPALHRVACLGVADVVLALSDAGLAFREQNHPLVRSPRPVLTNGAMALPCVSTNKTHGVSRGEGGFAFSGKT